MTVNRFHSNYLAQEQFITEVTISGSGATLLPYTLMATLANNLIIRRATRNQIARRCNRARQAELLKKALEQKKSV
jgi:hypothetical protein